MLRFDRSLRPSCCCLTGRCLEPAEGEGCIYPPWTQEHEAVRGILRIFLTKYIYSGFMKQAWTEP